MKLKLTDITRLALLTSAALVLSYIEHLLPLPIPIPGIKLGLSNTVLLYALYLMGKKQAVLLMLLKVLISAFAFSGAQSLPYSLAGGILSIICMCLIMRINEVSIIGVSCAGAAAHNIGQCIIAAMFISYKPVLLYLPFLLIAALLTGALTGIIAKHILSNLSRRNTK